MFAWELLKYFYSIFSFHLSEMGLHRKPPKPSPPLVPSKFDCRYLHFIMLLPPQKRRTAILKWFLIYEHEYENGCHKIIPNG